MNSSRVLTLIALSTIGLQPALAQEVDVKAELASQAARIADLEKKAASKPQAGPIKFPEEFTPYILIDTTIVDKTNTTADGHSKIDFAVPFLSGSRWGLKGAIKTNVEGLKVIWKLESEYTTFDGAMDTPNVLFNRDAWVGFASKAFGQITFGRQNTLARDFAVIYGDPVSHAVISYDEGGWTNTNNFKQLIYFAASVDGTRVNRGIQWKNVMESGLVLGAAYNLSSTESTVNSMRNSTGSVAAGYNASTWHVAAFHTEANNNGFTQKASSIGGNIYPVSWLRINAGYFIYSAEQGPGHPDRSDSAYTVSASIRTNPRWSFYLARQTLKANDAGLNSKGFMQNPFSNGSASTLFGTGSKDTTYGGVMRHLSPRMEAYLMCDYMKLHDNYKLSGTNGHDSQREIAIGIRIRAL